MRTRSLAWLLVVVLSASAAGCNSNAENPTSGPQTSAPRTSAPGETSTPGETAPSPVEPSDVLPAVEPTGTVSHGELAFAGRDRTYRLYIPRGLPSGPVALFIGLHGGLGWGDQFARVTGIEGLAQAKGFIVVHPDGVKSAIGPGGVWNGGICCAVAARGQIDDVGFIDALIDKIADDHRIDPNRIFAFGHSNGGIMSYRLACELSRRITGIGVVAGTLGVERCDLDQPVSIIHVHGAADRNIPITGGQGPLSISRVDFPSPRDGFDALATLSSCPGADRLVKGDITTEQREPCEGGVAAVFVTIESAGHRWAGSGDPKAYADYDATYALVSFLLTHPRR